MITIMLRSVVLVLFGVLSVRLMGKRQVGQLQPFELVITIMIADLATAPMESLDVPLWRGIVPMLSLVVLHQAFTLISLKSQRTRAFFSGRPTVVIRKGKIDFDALEKLAYNLNDLLEELRTGGILSPTDVGTAIMETSGKLSVFPSSRTRPVTPRDMDIDTGYEGIPITLVMDGKLEPDNLKLSGLSEERLRGKLSEMGYDKLKDVLLCYVDTDGRMTAQGYGGSEPVRGEVMRKCDVKW